MGKRELREFCEKREKEVVEMKGKWVLHPFYTTH